MFPCRRIGVQASEIHVHRGPIASIDTETASTAILQKLRLRGYLCTDTSSAAVAAAELSYLIVRGVMTEAKDSVLSAAQTAARFLVELLRQIEPTAVPSAWTKLRNDPDLATLVRDTRRFRDHLEKAAVPRDSLYCKMHADLEVKDNRMLLLEGLPGMGKSTLMAALAKAGRLTENQDSIQLVAAHFCSSHRVDHWAVDPMSPDWRGAS